MTFIRRKTKRTNINFGFYDCGVKMVFSFFLILGTKLCEQRAPNFNGNTFFCPCANQMAVRLCLCFDGTRAHQPPLSAAQMAAIKYEIMEIEILLAFSIFALFFVVRRTENRDNTTNAGGIPCIHSHRQSHILLFRLFRFNKKKDFKRNRGDTLRQ